MRMITTLALLLLWCGCGEPPTHIHNSQAMRGSGGITVSLVSTPKVQWLEDRTAVSLEFVARMPDGTPLSAETSTFQIRRGDEAWDPEIVQNNDARAQKVNVLYTLVLDATYSMLTHNPPAFEPMRQAAQHSVEKGQELMAKSGRGAFDWQLFWFDDALYSPLGQWTVADIGAIPLPAQGAFTRLDGAVDNAIKKSSATLQSLASQTEGTWQHVMLVFSDGADNHSWADKPSHEAQEQELPLGGLKYLKQAMGKVERSDMLRHVEEERHFTLHTIGMGSDREHHQQLSDMAERGHGTFQADVTPDTLREVFERVTYEFTTVQSAELSLPWPPGDYTLTVRVHATGTDKWGERKIRLHAGDSTARPL